MKPPSPFLEVVPAQFDPDPEVDRLFARARELAEPSAENRERVSSALREALPQLSGSAVVERGLSAAPARTRLEPKHSPIDASRPSALRRVMRSPTALLLGGALLGALGFWLGHGVGYSSGERAASLPDAGVTRGELAGSGPAHAVPAPGSEMDAQGGEHGSEENTAAELDDGVAPASPAARESASSVTRAQGGPARATVTSRSLRAASDAARASAAAAPRKGAAQSLSFRQVLEQLRRAQQQLRNGQATMSLLVLSELDRGAGELLREERETTRVLSLCAAGEHAAARDVAARLEQTSPRSIYGMRLAASCVSADPATDL